MNASPSAVVLRRAIAMVAEARSPFICKCGYGRFVCVSALAAEMVYEMKRTAAFVLLATVLSSNAVNAQSDRPEQHGRTVVVVSSSAVDARFKLVDEAVSFWNMTFQEIGACYSLGPVTRLVQPVPEEALQSVGQLVEGGRGPFKIPPVLLDQSGDITIFLAESEFISFTVFGPDRKDVLGIRGLRFRPLTLPNVARNVITQLLGYALGLRQNSDPTTLMCGRPAPCRPALFRSVTPRVFPLTETERQQLRTMYPSCVAQNEDVQRPMPNVFRGERQKDIVIAVGVNGVRLL
jgi:hypothetical protein